MAVKWRQAALRQLLAIFQSPGMTPADWDALARDVASINRQLGRSATRLGESRGTATRRVWFSTVLVVGFEIAGPDTVRVYHVALLGRRGGG